MNLVKFIKVKSMAIRFAGTGASAKTGSRNLEEALARGWDVKAILRPHSHPPEHLARADLVCP